MKGTLKTRWGLVFSVVVSTVVIGCGGSSDDGNGGSSRTGGTSTIRGTITSFETAGKTFVPVEQKEEGLLVRAASWLTDALVPTAYAAGNREGIVVTLTGPVSQTTTTAADGTFVFSNLPAGSYALTFEYNGVEVRYRGNSGQVATIVLEEDQIVDLVIRISGGKVNIGNIKVMPADDSQ